MISLWSKMKFCIVNVLIFFKCGPTFETSYMIFICPLSRTSLCSYNSVISLALPHFLLKIILAFQFYGIEIAMFLRVFSMRLFSLEYLLQHNTKCWGNLKNKIFAPSVSNIKHYPRQQSFIISYPSPHVCLFKLNQSFKTSNQSSLL